jgi:AcrR family transcriptional regulator
MRDDPKRRSDAERNREAILSAALDALTESSDVSLNAIAKRANVANATLYRHFPTREQLVLGVYEEEVRHLVDAADVLLEEESPSEARSSSGVAITSTRASDRSTVSANGWPMALPNISRCNDRAFVTALAIGTDQHAAPRVSGALPFEQESSTCG